MNRYTLKTIECNFKTDNKELIRKINDKWFRLTESMTGRNGYREIDKHDLKIFDGKTGIFTYHVYKADISMMEFKDGEYTFTFSPWWLERVDC